MAGFTHLHVDDVPARPGAGIGHEWLAMRHALGVEAFGLNAYRAPSAGVEIIEPHDEAGGAGAGGHQELYLVLSGRATFTVGDSTFEARAGSFVFIPDPALRRVAVADEPGTTIVAVGAEKGVAFEPSEWEARWLAEQPAG
jgi:mannose-6-phosphate isomerase-like protein (cupin superfamily)